MRESNFDVFDPRTVVMDCPEDVCHHHDFVFAFDDTNFSDRVLSICIISDYMHSTSVRIKTLNVSSPILAARSPFFYKLFSNGSKHANLRINASEEAGLMELLKFMYSNSLRVTTVPAVLDVLMAANKFDVASCMRACSRLLRHLPTMTPEYVLDYIGLPSTILMAKTFQLLTVVAKQLYAVHYKDISMFEDELLGLPLAGVEAIIASDDLKVTSEDAVYWFVLKWARAHYPKIEDRREIITKRLGKFIRYPYMTRGELQKVRCNQEFDGVFAIYVTLEASYFKSNTLRPEHSKVISRGIKDENSRRLVERGSYKYLDLKHDACASIFPSGMVRSEPFSLKGHGFYLMAECNNEQLGFGIFLEKEKVSSWFHLDFSVFDYEFAVQLKAGEEFVSKFKGRYTYKCGKKVGCPNLFGIPWGLFIGEDNVYFVDGVLHLRLSLKRTP